MIKKPWAVFFLMLANITLLTHAIIPHHHENFHPCIPAIHEQACEDHGHDIAHHHCTKHEHHPVNDNNCQLNQVYLNQSKSHRIDPRLLTQSAQHFDWLTLPYNPYCPGIIPVSLSSLTPDFLSAAEYSALVIHGIGLRAPPQA